MDAHGVMTLMAVGGGLAVVLWVLAKIGRALAGLAEMLAALAVVGMVLWGLARAVGWVVRQLVTHWRTCLALVAA
jgi:S-DNA-T family DNA segregation ATPase FtsK/SpoIIIE